MADKATLTYNGKSVELPVVIGTEREVGIDIQKLRGQTGWITLDDSYGNTGACESQITFIDGEKGILRYRGYPIDELAQQSTFVETAYLLIFGELPTRNELSRFSGLLTEHEAVHEGLRNHFEGFPSTAHPMAILSAMINAASCYQPVLMNPDEFEHFEESAA
ncbi:MAG: citrate (Si)-synthase, partial [Phycisphaerales bacterium]|nr:citrate (Si)-synthase [Phycisphaerales bacterium]